ncbi:tyrosine-type recombinase/integrase, partial [Brachybacterium alimentarium]
RALGAPKTHERRAVPLTGFLVDELRALTAGQAADGFVFRAQRGGAIDDHNWRIRVFGPAAADAGLAHRGLTPHKLRHTAASAAIAAGADVMVVKQMLGHADAKQTLNTYSHLWPDRLDEVADAMEQARTRHLQLVPVPGEVPQKCPTPILGGESETA